MRLLFVHRYLGAKGGAEVNISLTAENLRRRGHVTGLLYRETTGQDENRWQQLFPEAFPLSDGSSGRSVAAAVARFGPDLIYVHNLDELETLEALLQSRVPIVRMVHDHSMYCMRGYKYNCFTRKVCKKPAGFRCVFPCLAPLRGSRGGGFPLKWASYAQKRKEIRLNQQFQRLVVFSDYMRQELLRNGFAAEKIEVHPPSLWAASTSPQTSSFGERNLILYAGQLIRGKGVDLLLRALARVKVPFECVIAGEGNYRATCERLCQRLGLAGKVRFCGFMPQAELRSYYEQASVFVVSSVWPEPFGLSGPEAMLHGLPVVAFEAGGIGEWLTDGENGYLVPWMDTEQLAARIEELLQNKELARSLGRCGRQRVQRDYSPARAVERLENLFQCVLQPTHQQAGPLNCPLSATAAV